MDGFALRDRTLFGLAKREAELLDTIISNVVTDPVVVAERIARIRGLREAADILRGEMEKLT